MAGLYGTPYLQLLEGFPWGTLGIRGFLLMSEETGGSVWSQHPAIFFLVEFSHFGQQREASKHRTF